MADEAKHGLSQSGFAFAKTCAIIEKKRGLVKASGTTERMSIANRSQPTRAKSGVLADGNAAHTPNPHRNRISDTNMRSTGHSGE